MYFRRKWRPRLQKYVIFLSFTYFNTTGHCCTLFVLAVLYIHSHSFSFILYMWIQQLFIPQSLCTLILIIFSGESIGDSMKNSPHNGPGTPREEGAPPGPNSSDMPAGYNAMPPYQDTPPVNSVSHSLLYGGSNICQ